MAKGSVPAACKGHEKDLVLYYYGECSVEDRDRIQTHLEHCASCSRFVEELRTLLPLTIKADDPPQPFWDSYSKEVRDKLASAETKEPWWEGLFSILRPWRVPAFATGLVVILAVTLTLTRENKSDFPSREETTLEALPMAENLEFYKSMEFLDSLDLLEDMGGSPRG